MYVLLLVHQPDWSYFHSQLVHRKLLGSHFSFLEYPTCQFQVQSILVFGALVFLWTIVKLNEVVVVISLGSMCISAALGFILLLGADRRDVDLAKTFYVGVCFLLVIRGLSIVGEVILGEHPANFFGEALAIGLNLYFLSVVNSFIEEIKAESRSEAEVDGATGETDRTDRTAAPGH